MTINLKNFLNPHKKMSKMGEFQELKSIEGLEVSSISADLYGNGRDDLSLFYFKDGANYAVAYTSNSIVSETINWNRKNTKNIIKALVVNTKNANTFTGIEGMNSIDEISRNLSKTLTIKESQSSQGVKETVKPSSFLFASTGVIGEKFPEEKIKDSIQNLVDRLKPNQNKLIWLKVASAIMTTDTKPKLAYDEFKIGNKTIKIAGIAKGSGMIAPNLATMLSFIFTNVDISSNILKRILKKVLVNTFNAITVDNDTSTNDTVAVFSTKKIKVNSLNSISDPDMKKFEDALKTVCLNLAQQIIVDGEGAKKFITVKVVNSTSLQKAKNIAFSIANSPLIKTAVAGEDPNWGRIIMGIGKSGEKIDIQNLKIKLGEFIVAENGKIADTYDEQKLKEYMKWNDILIEVDLSQGKEHFECYTCDFTHDYIDINADYRRT
ncbi:MAG: glutamate N-acetyltransferase / amino-acid N-acetyltransferase [Pelagibacterales bacterium]|nr:glutamate N-acetyltransferase / amino-acid N-acetyltransferase [Pelagibacterales bacterium]